MWAGVRPRFVWGDTGVEGDCRTTGLHFAGVVHGFRPEAVALVCGHTSQKGRGLVSWESKHPLHNAVVLRCMRRGRLALDPQLFQERLNSHSNSPPPSVRMVPILMAAGAICSVTSSPSSFAASLLCLRKRMNFKRVNSSTHSIAYQLPPKEVT